MIINHNLNAMNSHRQMGVNMNQGAKAMEKLSSGMSINRAGDDAAGLSISEKMRGQIRGLEQASRNAQDGISLIQTAEGALNETHAILQRMRELAVQGANDTNAAEDRVAIKAELDELSAEVDRIAADTEFNTQNLVGAAGAGVGTVSIQTGANSANSTIDITLSDMTAGTLGVGAAALVVDTNANANTTIDSIQGAIDSVSAYRSELGATQNRLEHTIKNLDNGSENLQAAESRIRDTDMAKEMMEFTRSNILNQASQAMLAQANQQPQAVLQLLR
ncbi:flagellin [Jeotgalibacillus haloalkalitolerans]|uniref:Flagellin n=1 Tax=Jeotgalibacillus haloalkalitolerans TaxID=3104292 RepID=A0ABU5KL59_9BACL|nr:flagellin [Jeotgalibacillus sp. HH7-29]MDZ5711481.1 flagellin [Jeotgalibacillus sp. HH7-29]